MRIFRLVTAIFMLAALALPAWSEDAVPFTDYTEVVLVDLLPPPPADDSAQTKAELGEILTLQVTRTPEMAAAAIADNIENIWVFGDVIDNPKFTPENLPVFAAFFDRIVATKSAVVDAAKAAWKRPRPHILSDLVRPIVPLSTTGAYPSGHTVVGTLEGIVLSNMLPELRAKIMARAWEYGDNRVVAGIHYPSDVEAGRLAATAIAQTIQAKADFKVEFEAAKAELRRVLGLN